MKANRILALMLAALLLLALLAGCGAPAAPAAEEAPAAETAAEAETRGSPAAEEVEYTLFSVEGNDVLTPVS